MIKAPGSRRHPIRVSEARLSEMARLNRKQAETDMPNRRAYLVIDGVHFYCEFEELSDEAQ